MVVEAHHVAAAGIVQIRVIIPCAEPGIAGGLRGAGDDGEHVGIGDVQDLPHLPADRGERYAVHAEPIRVVLHVVDRADQTAVRRERRGAVDQVQPLRVLVLLQHAGGDRLTDGGLGVDARVESGGLELHLKHLVVVLQSVLDQQERFVPLAPVDGGQVLVGLVVPVDVGHVADLHARFGEVGEGEGVLLVGGDGGGPGLGGRQDGEVDVGQGDDGVPGQGAGVAAGRGRLGRVGGVADVPQRLRFLVGGLHEQRARVRGPPEAFVAVHLFAGHELGQAHGLVRIGALVLVDADDGPILVLGGVGAQRDHADLAAGGVGDQLAVRGDARHDDGQLRVGERDLAGLAAGAILVDFGQEQLAVDGEHHAAAGDVHRVGDDALPAFAGAFAAGLLLLGDLLVVGVGQQPARIGEQHLAVVGAVGGPDAQPQRRDQVLGAVGA